MKEENRNTEKKQIIEEDEIDLVEVAKTIWANRKIIYKTVAVFFILGLVVAFGSKVEYEASSKLLPDSQDGAMPNLGGLGGLAGLAGINLNLQSEGVISPNVYPQIVESLSFQLDLVHDSLYFENIDTTTTSYIYFTEINSPSLLSRLWDYSIGLPFKLKDLILDKKEINEIKTKDNLIKLTKDEFEIVEDFRERIIIVVDDETGIITLTTEMPDPVASAQLANKSIKLLQERIIDYKINKAKSNLEFVEERYLEAKNKFEFIQEKLATFRDQHKNVVTAMAQTQEQRLQNEYDIAFEVYKGLAARLEQATIKVKEETPVFTIIQPISVPIEKSKPKRLVILIIFSFIGVVVGLVYLPIRKFMHKINSRLNSNYYE